MDNRITILVSQQLMSSEIFNLENTDNSFSITKKDESEFFVVFATENAVFKQVHNLLFANQTFAIPELNFEKAITDMEFYHISNDENIILVTSHKRPSFLYENNMENKYPKVEVNLSDKIYNLKIYLNEMDFIETSYYHSSAEDIPGILKSISEIVDYITNINPELMMKLCTNTSANVKIQTNDISLNGKMNYVISPEGLTLSGAGLTNYKVEYPNLFKYLLDGLWELEFEEVEDVKEQDSFEQDNMIE